VHINDGYDQENVVTIGRLLVCTGKTYNEIYPQTND